MGDTAIRNYNKWADIRVNMDTLCPGGAPDTTLELFGKSFRYPFFAGPVGAVNLHYSDTYTDMTITMYWCAPVQKTALQPLQATAPTPP